jgi:hypothetical protein
MAVSASFRILLNKIKWFAYERLTSLSDAFLYLINVHPKGTKAINNEKAKIIVYVGGFLHPRIARLAKWTRRVGGYKAILLCHKQGFHEKFSNPDIDFICLFRNKWHLKRIIRSLTVPYILHGFAPKSNFPYVASMECKKNRQGNPFVIDYQDVFAIYYGTSTNVRWLKQELPYEKYCLQHADGIVAHSLEPREGMKVWDIHNKAKRIFMPLYADNDCFCNTLKKYDTNDIHFVYAGGVFGSHRDKKHYGGTQFHWLIDYLTEQKIHFHIYPSPSIDKADYEEYVQIAKNNSFFHFHSPVSQSNLSKELSQYHYGLMPFFSVNSGQSDLKYKYATTLKLFNYTEAGIPILVGADVIYQSWLVGRYKLGIPVATKDDFKNIRPVIEKAPYSEQVNNVLLNREKLSLKHHSPRLIKFYEGLKKNN